MASFLFVLHHARPEAGELALTTMEHLAGKGHHVGVLRSDAEATALGSWVVTRERDEAAAVDLAVSLGGDGTMLRTLDLMCPAGVPVLGVNVGHLGYLTEVDPPQLLGALDRFLAGDFQVEERMMLDVTVTSVAADDPTKTTILLSQVTAVNEVVVEKTSSGHTVRLQVDIEGRPFLSYAVDGMIIATPTGSTAYNLSARGPILSPALKALLMTPVSPHMLFDRSLVLDGKEELSLQVIGSRPASVVVDGRHVATLTAGGVVTCRQADLPARLVTFAQRDFRQVLKAKFGLADR